MNRHFVSSVALLIMVLFAFGSMDSSTTVSPTSPQAKTNTPSSGDDSVSTDSQPESRDTPTAPLPASKTAKLIIEDWHFSREYGFVRASGQVTNNTPSSLANVTAVTTFYTSDGSFVKTSEAVVSYNPILPGQTSPFETIDTDNPAIARASVTFKFLLGGTIPCVSREEYDKPTPEELETQRLAEEEAARARDEQARAKAAANEAAKWRTWSTADGRFTLEAKFVKYALGTLTLERRDGTTTDVELQRLCIEDQEFVKKRKWLTVGN